MSRKLTVIVDEELDERFREAVFRSKGMKKGNISESIEEAIELWIDNIIKKDKEIPLK